MDKEDKKKTDVGKNTTSSDVERKESEKNKVGSNNQRKTDTGVTKKTDESESDIEGKLLIVQTTCIYCNCEHVIFVCSLFWNSPNIN